VSDRFYRTLYELLLAPQLQQAFKSGMFLSLLFRAMKADASLERTRAFAKRLLQLCHYHPASFVCAALYLLGAVRLALASVSLSRARADSTHADHCGEAGAR
jgi:ribosome biogenesis protein MAK21